MISEFLRKILPNSGMSIANDYRIWRKNIMISDFRRKKYRVAE